jgi:hypothetical protein
MNRKLVSIALAGCLFGAVTVGQVRSAHAALPEIFRIAADGTLYRMSDNGVWEIAQLGNVNNVTAVSGTAGGTLLGPTSFVLATLAASLLIAGVTVVAIDCATHDECIWTAVSNAGGFGAVSGWSPNPNAGPVPGVVTVNCADPRPLSTQCAASSLRNTVTSYASCPYVCSYWTCGQIWDNGATTGGADWMTALASCNVQLQSCVATTANICVGNGIARFDVQPMQLEPAGAE